MTIEPRLVARVKRPLAAAAAAVLVLPLTVSAVAPTAAATVLVDRGWPPSPGQPYGYVSPYASTSALDTSEATTSQASGLVTITSTVEFGAGEAAGTGIVIGSDGLVVTNHHVVEGATSISVTVANTGETYDAEVLGYNAKRDVAVLQLEDASGLVTAATAATDAAGVAVGEDVTAVGDAGGDGGALTAADGTVTDTDHPITVADEQTGDAHRLTQLIEVDADIIPGDSGGALLSSAGEVVGMNVAASSGSAQITGYVIPIKRVLRIAAHVVAGEQTASITLGYDAFLGVSLSGTGTTLAGVVDRGAAAGAGLGAGDTVTSLGGASVSTYVQLQKAVAAHAPGDTVRVTWTDASGSSHAATVTLGRAPVA